MVTVGVSGSEEYATKDMMYAAIDQTRKEKLVVVIPVNLAL